MGNTGVTSDPKKGNHVHYQLKDSAGTIVDPSAYWDQQGAVDPNPAPPPYLGDNADNTAPMHSNAAGLFGTAGQFAPGSATSSRVMARRK